MSNATFHQCQHNCPAREEKFAKEVIDRLARIETKIEGIPGRVSALESWKDKATGYGAALVFILTIGANWVYQTFFGRH